MKKNQRFYFACLLAGTLGCSSGWAGSPNAKAASPDAKGASSDAKAGGGQFEQLVDDFVFGTLALSPTLATSYGYHVHDGASLDDVLDDFSPAGIAASRAFLQDIEGGSAKLDRASRAAA